MFYAPCKRYNLILHNVEIESKNPKSAELQKTYSENLKITISKPEQEESIVFSYEIPKLINNHFMIAGHKKIPVFQIYDLNVVNRCKVKEYAKDYKFDMLKIRTNIQNITLNMKKRSKRRIYSYNLSFSSKAKDVPFVYFLYLYYGFDKLKQIYEIDIQDVNDTEYMKTYADNTKYSKAINRYKLLREDIVTFVNNFEKKENEGVLEKYFIRRKDSDIMENILSITEIDIFSKRYFKTDNMITEFEYFLKNPIYSTLEFANKRIRFAEYVLYYWLCRDLYNVCMQIRSGKKDKFHVNTKSVIRNANVSDITQYDMCVNPIDQLSMLSKTALTGPGGLAKDKVPSYLRDIQDSQYGLLCGTDTGDRSSAGTIQYLVSTAQFDKDTLQFKPKKDPKNITSIPIQSIPFMEHNDTTRLQMASSHHKHAVMLEQFDSATVQSGLESHYSEYTSFMFKAKDDGLVIYKTKNIIIVKYDNGNSDAYDIGYKKLAMEIGDLCKCYFNEGDRFKKDDIIAESNYYNKGRLTLGREIPTAIMVWHGYNYEDGIVISQKCVDDDIFTSRHYCDLSYEVKENQILMQIGDESDEYIPFPRIGDKFECGEVYAKIKSIYTDNLSQNLDSIFDDPIELRCEEDCIITDVNLYVNKYSADLPEYASYIQRFMDQKEKDKKDLQAKLVEHLGKEHAQDFMIDYDMNRYDKRRGFYRVSGDVIEGMYVEITAQYRRKIACGDKIQSKNGCKGIIAKICPEHLMPMLPDGRRALIVINPLGIISRMVIGQLFEIHTKMAIDTLKRKLLNELSKENLNSIYNQIIAMYDIVDKTDGRYQYKEVCKYLNDLKTVEEYRQFINEMYIIQPPFQSMQKEDVDRLMKYCKCPYKYKIYDPLLYIEECKMNGLPEPTMEDILTYKDNLNNPVVFGYLNFMKLNHIAKDKLCARSIGPYSIKTSQPLEGKRRGGGQRLGEMEIWALASAGSLSNLHEMITTKQDSIALRNKYIADKLNMDDVLYDEGQDYISQSSRLFQWFLAQIGVHCDSLEENINNNELQNNVNVDDAQVIDIEQEEESEENN